VYGFSFAIHSLLIPAQALKKVRFDEKLRRHQDWDLVLRLVAAGFRYVYSHEPAGIYMLGDDNRVSRSKGADATLYWFEKDRELLLSPACAYYYARHYFTKHMRDKPKEALRAVSKLALADIKSFFFTVRAFAGLALQRVGLRGRA
jgi:GT2 family glycosyltransferase